MLMLYPQPRQNFEKYDNHDLEEDIYQYQVERRKAHSYERARQLEWRHEEEDDEHQPNILQVSE